MRKRIVLLVLAALAGLASVSPALAGIAPVPFYTEFPDIPILQARVVNVATSYPDLLSLPTADIAARVPLIRSQATRPEWVTDTLAKQGLGLINNIAEVLNAAPARRPTSVDAARMVALADLVSRALTNPALSTSPLLPQALHAIGHISPGLSWHDEDLIHPYRFEAAAFDIMARITAVLFAPQPEPPKTVVEGVGALDRITAVLFAPQPEPPRILTQALEVMDRTSSVLGAPQAAPPDVFEDSLRLMERISAVLFAPQPEPPKMMSDLAGVMERISAVLFAPQPEPPKMLDSRALGVMDRITAVLFAPQPEPPKQLYEDLTAFDANVISVVYRVAGAAETLAIDGLAEGAVPGMTALTQLSKHLVTAALGGNVARANGQLGAMLDVSLQYEVR